MNKEAKEIKQGEMKLNPEAEFDKRKIREDYERDKEELESLVGKVSLRMTEMFLENTFLVGQWKYLEGYLHELTLRLKKTPMDITLQIEINKVQNDLEIIKPASAYINAAICSELEIKWGQGKQFKFLRTLRDEKIVTPK